MVPLERVTQADAHFMRRALRVARLGVGRTHPNPRVGALAVREGRIVACGAHLAFGGPHAEAQLIARADAAALRGATLYVTLEPCAHIGKTPACAPAVAEAGFRRVVVAMEDPHPRVRGRGLAILRRAGLALTVGVTEQAAKLLNAPFLWLIEKERSFITLKIAASLDGRLAAEDGSSRWITSARARERVQQWRAMADAILVGRGTFEADRPRLTARPRRDRLARLRRKLDHGAAVWPPQPVRILLDSKARVAGNPQNLADLRSAPGGRWIVACGSQAPRAARRRLEEAGLGGWELPQAGGAGIDLRALSRRMAREGLLEVMVEGGGRPGDGTDSRGSG